MKPFVVLGVATLFLLLLTGFVAAGLLSLSDEVRLLADSKPVLVCSPPNVTVLQEVYNHTYEVERFSWGVFVPSVACQGVSQNELLPLDAEGFSMEPYFMHWHKPLYKPYTGEQLVVGDVLLYRTREGGELMAHRLDSVYGDRLVLCPDYHPGVQQGAKLCDMVGKELVEGVVCGVLYG